MVEKDTSDVTLCTYSHHERQGDDHISHYQRQLIIHLTDFVCNEKLRDMIDQVWELNHKCCEYKILKLFQKFGNMIIAWKILSYIYSGWRWKEKLRKVSRNTSPTRNVRQTTGMLYRWKFGCHVLDCVWWLGHWAPHSYQRQGCLDDVDRRTTERIVSKAIFHSYYYPLHF